MRALFVVCALTATLHAQPYTVDLARHFYATPADEAAAVRRIDALIGELAPSANDFERMLATYESLLVAVNRHDAYLTLRYATNTTDEAAREESRALDAKFEKADTAVRRALAGIPESALKRPSLRPYAYFIRASRGLYPPSPTCDAPAETWQSDLRDLALANGQKRDVVAFALIHLAASRHAAAKAHGFPDAVTEAYARNGWTRAQVDALLEQLAERAPLYHRFQQLHAAANDAPKPQFTIDETRALLLEILGRLGPSYRAELAKLLDPAERRLDILPGPNRRRGGFSLFTGTNSIFFMSGFRGAYNDVRVLTHESTHAMQRQLMARHGVRPVYRDGPKYLFEATAIFNELLLPDALALRTTDPGLRAFYLDQFLGGKGIEVIYTAAAEAALEQAVYDGVARGEIRNADDLDALTAKVMGRYSTKWPAARWMEIPLMYEDPFYDLNYAWAGLVALNTFARYEREPAATARGYIALLENGFDHPAAELLREHLGIDIAAPSFVDDALAVAKTHIDAFETAR